MIREAIFKRSCACSRGKVLSLALVCLVGLLSGCVAQEAERPLRVGISPWPVWEFAHLARDKGMFATEGVDVQLLEFPSLSDARRAYERGQIDGLFSGVIEVLQAQQSSGRRTKIVMMTDFSNGADVVLAKAPATSPRDLKGKRIGLEVESLNIFVLARALQIADLDLNAVRLVNLQQDQLPGALRRGDIDAAVTYPPVSTTLHPARKLTRVFSSAEIPGEVAAVLSFDEKVLRRRGQEVHGLIRAFFRAQDYARDHHDEAMRIMATQEQMTPAAFERALSDGIRVVGAKEQHTHFAPGGSLEVAVALSSKILLATHQLKDDVRARDLLEALPVTQ